MADQVALITGGARGQGAAHAEALARDGFRVVIADVRDADGEATAAALRAKGLAVRYAHLDVTDAAGWAAAVADIEAHEGGLDVLVNNAGIIRVTRLLDIAPAEWELLQRVNATSVVLGIQAAAPALTRRGSGSIVNVASTAAHRGAEGYAAYSASKAARPRHHPRCRPRARTERHPGQQHQPGWRRDADERRRAGRRHLVRRAARPSRTARGDLAAGRLPRDDGVRPTSPAPTSSSTAG